MAKAKRVHQVAKLLGVDSKTILAKCQAEGVPDMTNHMSVVSLGLEMTLKEWFSEDDGGGTAIETAEKVDVKQVRAKARRKAKPKGTATDETDETTADAPASSDAPSKATDDADASTPAVTAVQEEPSTPEAIEAAAAEAASKAKSRARKRTAEDVTEEAEADQPAPTEAASEPSAEASEVIADTPEAQPAVAASTTSEVTEEAPAQEQSTEATPEVSEVAAEVSEPAKAPARSRAVMNVPTRPEVIKPAGKKLKKPAEVKLRGPKVIRQEAPDLLPEPRRRRTGPAQSAAPQPGDVIRSRGPVRGRGAGGPAPVEDDSGRSPRRKRGGPAGGAGPAGGPPAGKKARPAGDVDTWRRGTFSEQDLIEREERLNRAGGFLKQRRRDMRKRAAGGGMQAATPLETGGQVEIAEPFTIKELSAVTGIKGADIVGYLFKNKGVMATINQGIEVSAAQEVCLEYNIDLVVKAAESAEQAVEKELENRVEVDVRRRPPVVAVLGHVDHGKTSLLDRIRQADVAEGEAGGITQHIGAYRATIKGTDGEDKTVVFLDTPGHEAFTAMRARGANLTDVVVVVVAADDGVMPQTIESINHAKAAGVPIVIALNKIDVPQATDANIQRILGQLAEHGLNPVEWGGETEVIRTSAETGDGVTDMMEILDYQAELLELTADYGGSAFGQVIEAELSEGRGPVARVLVRGGQMKIGDFIVMGRAFGRVRDMLDDRGGNIQQAGPATPLEISGIDEIPDAGDKFYVVPTLKQAERIAEQRRDHERKFELATKSKVTLDNLFDQMKAGEVKDLRVVIKADVQGSVEVLRKTLEEAAKDNTEVAVRVLHAAVGGITESDVILAEASDAIIVGFQVIASQHARSVAEQKGVDIRLYRVIYDIVDDIRAGLEGMLTPEKREQVIGHAEVREVFRVSKVGAVAGCYVTDGVIQRNAKIRVTRDDIVIEHDRLLSSLKRFKDDAREVRAGMECGMSIDGYNDIREGDILECYTTSEVKQKL